MVLAPLDLVTPSSLGTLGRDRGKERPELLQRAGEGLQRGPTLSLPHFKAAQAGSWAVALLRLPGKLLWGLSAHVFRAGLFCAAWSLG